MKSFKQFLSLSEFARKRMSPNKGSELQGIAIIVHGELSTQSILAVLKAWFFMGVRLDVSAIYGRTQYPSTQVYR